MSLSSSGPQVVEPIGELMLGADYVVATQMVVEDGKYTGEIPGRSRIPREAAAIEELATQRGYDLPPVLPMRTATRRQTSPHARGSQSPTRRQP